MYQSGGCQWYTAHMSMQNTVAIITGAGRGVGRAAAQLFAQEGAKVVLFSRTRETVESCAHEIQEQGGEVLAITGDVALEEDVLHLFEATSERFGRVDVLVNCAGIVAVQPFIEMESSTWDRVLAVNLRGTFLCCREAFRMMARQQHGVIVNISSLSGIKGVEKFPGLSAYNVSKSGIAGLTEILAVEGKPHNIRVCAVSPGAVDTEMLRQAAPHLRAGMTPDELAKIILFMADDESGSMFNGSNIELFTNG